MGKDTPDLHGQDCPDALAHLWGWFHQLNQGRTGNGYTANPLTYSEILAWSDLIGIRPTSRELRVLKRIDLIFLEVNAPERD